MPILIDSHCHLADEAFLADLDEVATRAHAAGVSRAVCILSADTAEEHARIEAVKTAWPNVVFATAIHPHRAGPYAGRVNEAVQAVRTIAAQVSAVLLGEMGLDYHYDFAPRDVQRAVFAAQVQLAVELNLPVAIHTREAGPDTIEILQDAGAGRVRGVMHCFTGTASDARQALDLGFYLSIPGIVTFPKAQSLRDVLSGVPLDRVLVESDAPYLAPVPHRGKRNEPAFVSETVKQIAAIHELTVEVVAEQILANFDRLLDPSRVDTPSKPVF
ncbi:MAG TPA: TatD family hydrolase [Vicinamibacterales bacterium]|nr:TatD family hydrolase [Vicinamibacterales bacterium]